MPIPDIRLDDVRIRDVVIYDVPEWMSSDPPQAIPALPPVTMEVGTPIVNIPGCVEAHKDNQENVNLKNEDDKGTMTLCDAGTPSYYPIDYDANKIKLEQEPPKPPAYKAPPTPEATRPRCRHRSTPRMRPPVRTAATAASPTTLGCVGPKYDPNQTGNSGQPGQTAASTHVGTRTPSTPLKRTIPWVWRTQGR